MVVSTSRGWVWCPGPCFLPVFYLCGTRVACVTRVLPVWDPCNLCGRLKRSNSAPIPCRYWRGKKINLLTEKIEDRWIVCTGVAPHTLYWKHPEGFTMLNTHRLGERGRIPSTGTTPHHYDIHTKRSLSRQFVPMSGYRRNNPQRYECVPLYTRVVFYTHEPESVRPITIKTQTYMDFISADRQLFRGERAV